MHIVCRPVGQPRTWITASPIIGTVFSRCSSCHEMLEGSPNRSTAGINSITPTGRGACHSSSVRSLVNAKLYGCDMIGLRNQCDCVARIWPVWTSMNCAWRERLMFRVVRSLNGFKIWFVALDHNFRRTNILLPWHIYCTVRSPCKQKMSN